MFHEISGTSAHLYLPLQKAVRELSYTTHPSLPIEMLQKYADAGNKYVYRCKSAPSGKLSLAASAAS
jgi:hypothetical protein